MSDLYHIDPLKAAILMRKYGVEFELRECLPRGPISFTRLLDMTISGSSLRLYIRDESEGAFWRIPREEKEALKALGLWPEGRRA